MTDNCYKPWPKPNSEHHVMVECRDGLYQFESLIDIRMRPGFWENEHRPDTEQRTKKKIEEGFYNKNIGKIAPTEADKQRERDPAWLDPEGLERVYPIGSMIPEMTRRNAKMKEKYQQQMPDNTIKIQRTLPQQQFQQQVNHQPQALHQVAPYQQPAPYQQASYQQALSQHPVPYQHPITPNQHQMPKVWNQESQLLAGVMNKAIDGIQDVNAALLGLITKAVELPSTRHKRRRSASSSPGEQQISVKKQKQEQSEQVRKDSLNDSHKQAQSKLANDGEDHETPITARSPSQASIVKREIDDSISFASDGKKIKVESVEDDFGCSPESKETSSPNESRKAQLKQEATSRQAPHSFPSAPTAPRALLSSTGQRNMHSGTGDGRQQGPYQGNGNSRGQHIHGYKHWRGNRGGRGGGWRGGGRGGGYGGGNSFI
jgi:hypothetical protein